MTSSSLFPCVRVQAARVGYAGLPLFEDLDFTLPSGEWTCLLGPSGVGKSSLLRLVAGLLPVSPDASVSCSDGRSASGRIAFMAQQDLLLPWLSVLENVTLGLRLRGDHRGPGVEERARGFLEEVGLGEAAGALPSTLSGGMRQRAALARTLMEDRPIVLLDEPFSALDAITKVRLQALFADALRGRTVLLVTHDPLEALRLGHRILVMAGRPVTLGAPITPSGAPPRDVHDPELLSLQADLLDRLSAAAEARP